MLDKEQFIELYNKATPDTKGLVDNLLLFDKLKEEQAKTIEMLKERGIIVEEFMEG